MQLSPLLTQCNYHYY